MDYLSEEMHADEKPINISLFKLPKCLFVIPISIVVNVPFITAVAICKSPYMSIIGWKRLLEDLIGREEVGIAWVLCFQGLVEDMTAATSIRRSVSCRPRMRHYVDDPIHIGSKLKFANRSADPNYYAKILTVGGDHCAGIICQEKNVLNLVKSYFMIILCSNVI